MQALTRVIELSRVALSFGNRAMGLWIAHPSTPSPLFPFSVSFPAAGSHRKPLLPRAEHSFKILRQPIEPDLPAGLLCANNIGQSPWHFLP